LAALDNLTQVAIGLEDGIVLLIKGDFSKDRFIKTKVIYEASSPITALGFSNEDKSLFITTLANIAIVSTLGKESVNVLDEQGCEAGNAIMTPPEFPPEMVMGRKEALYFYSPEGRGPCFIVGGEKSFMTWYHSYLVVVSVAPTINGLPSPENTSPISPSTAPLTLADTTSSGTVLTIYDLKSKYVAYRASFGTESFDPSRGVDVGEPILHVIPGPTELYVLTKSKKVFYFLFDASKVVSCL
jgi:hypothetical protein